jgi:hypothetical protein
MPIDNMATDARTASTTVVVGETNELFELPLTPLTPAEVDDGDVVLNVVVDVVTMVRLLSVELFVSCWGGVVGNVVVVVCAAGLVFVFDAVDVFPGVVVVAVSVVAVVGSVVVDKLRLLDDEVVCNAVVLFVVSWHEIDTSS